MLGHLPEMLFLAALGLLVFGPKRVIEMGSSLGKALREFQQATKDMNLSNLLTGEEDTSSSSNSSTLSRLSQMSQSLTSETPPPAEHTQASSVVESSPDQVN
ncbi:MAG TPA: twin-arginine translocase TatA/TatE family subunit [Ktedonobacterales bacterium]